MAFTKYQKVERADLATPEAHAQIEENLHRIGKTSARGLTEEERRQALDIDKPKSS